MSSSNKPDWILSEFPLLALSCLLYRRVSSLMNTLFVREISININKLFIVIFVLCLDYPCSVIVACLLVCPLFLYWCCCCLFISLSLLVLMLLLYIYIYVAVVRVRAPCQASKTKYEKYFFGDLLSPDVWQKLWE